MGILDFKQGAHGSGYYGNISKWFNVRKFWSLTLRALLFGGKARIFKAPAVIFRLQTELQQDFPI